jgi:bacteriocin biosynthesis cyclodehydratase domain-containing protein
VVLSAGADRRVAIDGVAAAQRAAVERWSTGAAVTAGTPGGDRGSDCDSDCGGVEEPGSRHQAVARLLDRLVELGVVVPSTAPGPPTVVADDPVTAGALGDLLTEGGAAGMLVLVRTGARWPTVPPGRLHLGVDLSLHHTVVLGPLVIPGASACLACLDARVARRWSAPTVPAEPAVRRRLPVVAALLDIQLALVAAGTSPLVNATIAWNLETGTTDRQSLYKLAGCPHCDTGPGDGRVALPWGAAP